MNLLDAPTDQSTERDAIIAKWKDKPREELEAAKAESDLYIKTIERRSDEFRETIKTQQEELAARANLQDLIDQMKSQKLSGDITPKADDIKDSPKFDPKEVESLVSQGIAKSKQADKETDNFNFVKSKLVEKFGRDYQSSLNDQMDSLGITADDLNSMARSRPQVLIKALGLDAKADQAEPFQSPFRSQQRQDSFAPKGQAVRNYAFYQEMKKTKPMVYLEPKIAIQMHDDAIAQGEAFFN